MYGFFQFQFLGIVATEPEFSQTSRGGDMLLVKCVSDIPFKDEVRGWTTRATWIYLRFFGDEARKKREGFEKGDKVFVNGHVQEFEGRNGKGYQFRATVMRRVEDRRKSKGEQEGEEGTESPRRQSDRPPSGRDSRGPASGRDSYGPPPGRDSYGPPDDDIPWDREAPSGGARPGSPTMDWAPPPPAPVGQTESAGNAGPPEPDRSASAPEPDPAGESGEGSDVDFEKSFEDSVPTF